MAEPTFEDLCQIVAEASCPDEVFSSLRLMGRVGWESALRGEYEQLRAVANPLQFLDPGARQGAEVVRRRLDELYREALGEGSEPEGEELSWNSTERPCFLVRTGQGVYQGSSVLARGDIATLYEGKATEGTAIGRCVVLKIADAAADNGLMLDEAAALERLHQGAGPQKKHLPRLIDQFCMPDGRIGLVLERLDGVDLLTVRERYPEGVPLEHVIWILRRILSAIGYVHQLGIIHGNIEPSHVMVRPKDHNVFLIDWCYSLIEPARSGRGFKCETPGYSAPEVGQRKPPTPASDLYSVGKCAVYLLGGDPEKDQLPEEINPRFARLLRHLCRPSALQRAQDAWEMFDEVGRARREIFGHHTFQEFQI
ncbi:MAG: protein kinase [Myxococcales bacterium]|nr:protein kinase [Polyangiaceae bacterium]MDW8248361.1 protein kinase [Myxococcales bacterium]